MDIISAADTPKLHKITSLSGQVKDQNRVNISIDGKYAFSLDIAQVTELGVKVGLQIDDVKLDELKLASDYGKLYNRALEYALLRPHSTREMRDYLHKKTLDKRVRVKSKTGEYKTKIIPGVSQDLANQVLARLMQRGYINDVKFTQFWIENRMVKKGVSKRRLTNELIKKGIETSIIGDALLATDRNDQAEIAKIIAKKRARYDDDKLTAYLARQGFSYDDIKTALRP
ncbi:RecX family transcriptional regulator [Candidatus Saccharibacteria bacterium]|nr:RecX family transcriptional regulator [Candidatus Saccharibacteria bacterium]